LQDAEESLSLLRPEVTSLRRGLVFIRDNAKEGEVVMIAAALLEGED
jgi:hypothetical protein